MINTYDKGDTVRFTATFKDLTGALADPSEVTFRVRNGSGTPEVKTFTGGTVAKDSLGVFHADYLVDSDGDWWYRFEASGTLAGAVEGKIVVKPSHF